MRGLQLLGLGHVLVNLPGTTYSEFATQSIVGLGSLERMGGGLEGGR